MFKTLTLTMLVSMIVYCILARIYGFEHVKETIVVIMLMYYIISKICEFKQSKELKFNDDKLINIIWHMFVVASTSTYPTSLRPICLVPEYHSSVLTLDEFVTKHIIPDSIFHEYYLGNHIDENDWKFMIDNKSRLRIHLERNMDKQFIWLSTPTIDKSYAHERYAVSIESLVNNGYKNN